MRRRVRSHPQAAGRRRHPRRLGAICALLSLSALSAGIGLPSTAFSLWHRPSVIASRAAAGVVEWATDDRTIGLPRRLVRALQRRLDVNKDGEISLEDLQCALDVNGDGNVDIGDLVTLIDANGDGTLDFQDVVHAFDANGDGKLDFQDILSVLDANNDGKVDFEDLRCALDLNSDGKVNLKDVEYALDLNKDGKVDQLDVRCAEDMLVAAIEGKAQEAEEHILRATASVRAKVAAVVDRVEAANARFAHDLRWRVIQELSYKERLEVFCRAFPAVLWAPGGLCTKFRRVRRCCFIMFGDFRRHPRELRFQRGDSVVSVVIARVVARHLRRVATANGLDLDGDGRVGLRDARAIADLGAVIGSAAVGAAAFDGNLAGAVASIREAGAAVQVLEDDAEAQLRRIVQRAGDRIRAADGSARDWIAQAAARAGRLPRQAALARKRLRQFARKSRKQAKRMAR